MLITNQHNLHQANQDNRCYKEEIMIMKVKKMLAMAAAAVMAASMVACGAATSSSEVSSASTETSSAAEQSSSAAEESSSTVPAGNADEHTVEAIKASGKLVVTTEATYPPFEFQNKDGEIVGLDASLAQALADDLGVELELQNIDFASVVTEVQAGNADMAIAGLSPTEDRKKSVDMSDLYYGGGQVLLILEENAENFTTAESLAGKTIATQKGAIQETLMKEQFADSTPLLLPKFPQCIQELKTGTCDAVMIDSESAKNYMKTTEGLAISEVPVETDPAENGNAIAVMKGNEDLLAWVNERIAEYAESGKIQEWYDAAIAEADAAGVMGE